MTRTGKRLALAAIVGLVGSAAAIGSLGGTARAAVTDGCGQQLHLCYTTTASWYTNPSGNGVFDTTGTFLFKQTTLNTIDYQVQSAAGVFTNTQEHGKLLPAQNATYKMGGGGVYPFEATFTGTLQVPSGGSLTLSMDADDGWYIGFGTEDAGTNQPTYVSGPQTNLPAKTFTRGFPVAAGVNDIESPSLAQFTINFPIPGDYPFEIDYTEVAGGQMALVFGDSTGAPITKH